MAIMQSDIPLPLLTFEQYMAEGEFNKRYAIIDGERIFMPSPTWRHQRISRNVTQALSDYEAAFQTGLMVSAPLDVLIQRQPLRTRQPDALFISHGRLALIGGTPPDGPLPIGPELIVEILSPSDTSGVLADKIADYRRAGVEECWLLHSDSQTVEILPLTYPDSVSSTIFKAGQNVQSVVFPDLVVAVESLFTV